MSLCKYRLHSTVYATKFQETEFSQKQLRLCFLQNVRLLSIFRTLFMLERKYVVLLPVYNVHEVSRDYIRINMVQTIGHITTSTVLGEPANFRLDFIFLLQFLER